MKLWGDLCSQRGVFFKIYSWYDEDLRERSYKLEFHTKDGNQLFVLSLTEREFLNLREEIDKLMYLLKK